MRDSYKIADFYSTSKFYDKNMTFEEKEQLEKKYCDKSEKMYYHILKDKYSDELEKMHYNQLKIYYDQSIKTYYDEKRTIYYNKVKNTYYDEFKNTEFKNTYSDESEIHTLYGFNKLIKIGVYGSLVYGVFESEHINISIKPDPENSNILRKYYEPEILIRISPININNYSPIVLSEIINKIIKLKTNVKIVSPNSDDDEIINHDKTDNNDIDMKYINSTRVLSRHEENPILKRDNMKKPENKQVQRNNFDRIEPSYPIDGEEIANPDYKEYSDNHRQHKRTIPYQENNDTFNVYRVAERAKLLKQQKLKNRK